MKRARDHSRTVVYGVLRVRVQEGVAVVHEEDCDDGQQRAQDEAVHVQPAGEDGARHGCRPNQREPVDVSQQARPAALCIPSRTKISSMVFHHW